MKFRLLKDRFEHKAGTEVFMYPYYTYGLIENDRRATGIAHAAVSLVENETPFFTVPVNDLEPIFNGRVAY